MMGLAPVKREGKATVMDPYGYVFALILKDQTRKTRTKPMSEKDATDLAIETIGRIHALR